MQHFSRARHEPTATGAALFLALLGWGAAVSGCQSQSTPEKEAAKPATTAAAPKAAATSTKPRVKKMEWDDPKQWKKIPANGMRYMSYRIPPVPGDEEIAELNVFVLGGDIESNIQRWINEFSGFDPKTLSRSDRVVNDMTQAVIEIPKGTFNGGMGEGGRSPNFGLLGAIVITPENSTYFFKMTGPSATVAASREAFYQLLDSVRLEGGTAAPDTAKTIKTVAGPKAPDSPGGAAEPAAAGGGTTAPAAAPSTPPPPKH